MPDLDKNYLAGLYLDEITLDVMPQEYIDAALEVKLRYDACVPRAGYNCVQDRRVKGGFYYRKAPQGQGVNALPPSKLERAMARSQEQPAQRSGLSFLSKAAIGAGVAIGGLALTGAVVNAGRSSEPYQEPVRQRSGNTQPNNNAVKVAAATVATAAAGFGAKSMLDKDKPQPQPQESQTITPQQSAKTEPPKPVKTPEEEEGYKEQQRRNQAIAELTRVGYDTQKKAYEQALSRDLEKAGVTPEGIGQKKKDLQFADDNEGFVRIDQVKENTADGVQLTKAARAKQSEDLQALYDKLKDNGVEDAIEFRPAIDKKFKKPLAASANKYTVDFRDGNPPVQVGEMRFRKNKDQIVGAIAAKIKSKDTPQSQPSTVPSKPAEPEMEVPKPLNKATQKPVTPPASKPQTTKEGAIAYLGQNMVSLGRGSADGYVNQSAILGDRVLGAQLGDNKALDLVAEGIAEGRIQKKVVGRNTYIRDIDATPFDKLISEAKGLTDVKDTSKDPRVQDLRDAATYKESRAKDSDKPKAAELQAAIAGIQEVKPSDRGGKKPPEPKPDNEDGGGGGKRPRGEGTKTAEAAAKRAAQQEPPDIEPSVVARSEQEIEADRIAAEQAEKLKKQQAAQSKREGLAGTSGRAEVLLTDKVLDLEMRRQKNEVEDKEFNAEVKKLRKEAVVVRAVTEAIRPTQEEYQGLVNNAKTAAEQKSLQEKGTEIMQQQARDVYDRFKIPELIEIAPKAKEVTPAQPTDKTPPVKTPTPEPNTLAPNVASGANAAAAAPKTASAKEDLKKAIAYIPLSSTEIQRMSLEAQSKYYSSSIERANEAKKELQDEGAIVSGKDVLAYAEEQKTLANNEMKKIANLRDKDEADLSGDLIGVGLDPMYSSPKEDKIKALLPFVNPKGEIANRPQPPSPAPDSVSKPAAAKSSDPVSAIKPSAMAERFNLTAEDEARYASISGSNVSADDLKGNEMLGKINTRLAFLQDQKKADEIEALLDRAKKGEAINQADIDKVSFEFDDDYSPEDLKSKQARSAISRVVSKLRLSTDVGEKPERRAKRMLLEIADLSSDPERLTSYLSSPANFSAFKAGTKEEPNIIDYISPQERTQLEALIKNNFEKAAIAAYKRGENYSNKDLQRVYKDLTGKRLSLTASQKKQVDKSKTEQSNDAIATPESYLQGYYEIRDKYRRGS